MDSGSRSSAPSSRPSARNAQFDACEPEHRLVARTLESRLELSARGAGARAAQARRAREPPSRATDRHRAPSADPADPGTCRACGRPRRPPPLIRKELLRTLIIEVDRDGQPRRRDGRRSRSAGKAARAPSSPSGLCAAAWRATRTPRGHNRPDPPPRRAHQRPAKSRRSSTSKAGAPAPACLHRPAREFLRQKHEIRAAPPPDPDSGLFTDRPSRARARGQPHHVYRWLRAGLLPGEQTTPHAPWRIRSPTRSARVSCPTCPTATCRWPRPPSVSDAPAKPSCTRSNAAT